MSTPDDHQEILRGAELAITHAQEVRAFHRKRTRVGNSQRNTDIRHAEQQVRKAMKPLRSALGRAPYDPDNMTNRLQHDELRAMSQRVQTERRKLWKLKSGGRKRLRGRR